MGSGILARHAVGRGAPRGRGRRGRRRRHHDRRVRLRITPRAEALDALVSPRRGGCRVRSVQPRDVARGSEERDRARRGRGRARCRRRAREARGGSRWGNRSVVRDLGGPRSAREAVADGPAPRRRRRRIRRRRRRPRRRLRPRREDRRVHEPQAHERPEAARLRALQAINRRRQRHAKASAPGGDGQARQVVRVERARGHAARRREGGVHRPGDTAVRERERTRERERRRLRGRRRGRRRRRRARRAGFLQAADAIRSR